MFEFNLEDRRLLEQAKRQSRARGKDFGKVYIKASGTILQHDLGVVPNVISIHPVDFRMVEGNFPTWLLYRQSDKECVYVKSSVDAYYLVYVKAGSGRSPKRP